MKALLKKNSFLIFMTHWGTWTGVALLSLTLYLFAWPLFYHMVVLPHADLEKHGLQVETFDRPELKGKSSTSFFSQAQKLTLTKPSTSLLAYGLWKVPRSGRYLLHLECDDSGNLNLDGKDLIHLTGINARNIGETEIELEAGYHLLVLRLFNGPGQGWLTLTTTIRQQSDLLLEGDSLNYVDLPEFHTWLKVLEGLKKTGWWLLIFSLGVIILLAFIHSGSPSPVLPSQEKKFFLSQVPKAKIDLGVRIHKRVLVSFWVLIILLGLLYQYNLFMLLWQGLSSNPFRNSLNSLTTYEKHLKEVRPLLPPQGTIGYFSDHDDPVNFFQTQYSLSPLLITRDSGPKLVFGFLPDPNSLKKPQMTHDFRIIRDFHNGLFLLERKPK